MAPLIFTGTVLSENHHVNSDGYSVGPGEYEYMVDVENTEKGTVEDPANLWTSDQGAACGTRLIVGDRYRLHPYRTEQGRLVIGMCSGDQHLGKGAAPPPSTTSTTRAPPRPSSSTTVVASTTQAPTSTELSTTTTAEASSTDDAAAPPTITVNDENDGDGDGDSAPTGLVAAAGAALALTAAAAGIVFTRRRFGGL